MAETQGAVRLASATSTPRRRLNNRQREALWGYAFMLPWILGFVVFLVGPMIASLYFSFTEYKVVRPPVWLGLDNYTRMFDDDLFYHSLRVTTVYTVLSVPLSIVGGLAIAVLLN